MFRILLVTLAALIAACGRAPVESVMPPPRFASSLDAVGPDAITAADPSSLISVNPAGLGIRKVYDRRVESWTEVTAWLYRAAYTAHEIEFQAHPEFDGETAREHVERYALEMGRLPAFLLASVKVVHILPGDELFSTKDGSIYIQAGQNTGGYLHEILFHEAAHLLLDDTHRHARGWLTAQSLDRGYATRYARDSPHEDLAETFLIWWATPDLAAATVPHRAAYFDLIF